MELFHLIISFFIVLLVSLQFFSKSITPASIITDIVAKQILKDWKKFLEKPPKVVSKNLYNSLMLANKYLSIRASKLYKLKHERESEARAKFYEQRNEVVTEKKESPILEVIFGVLGFLILSCILLSLLWFVLFSLPKILLKLINEFPEFVTQLIYEHPEKTWSTLGIITFYLAIVWIIMRTTKSGRFQEALATGVGHQWLYNYPNNIEECESQRQIIMNMMTSEASVRTGSVEEADEEDDIQDASEEPLPAPPGVAEVALSVNENAFNEMKRDLLLSRKMHTAISLTSFTLFLVAVIGSLYATIFLETANLKSILGGLGIGTILGTFTYFSLGNVRAAQLSMAIFESHLAEVNINLREVDMETCHNARFDKRSKTWSSFRKGVNALWREEQKHMKFWKPK